MKVFISHSSKDHDFVLFLAKRLKKDLIDVWVDDWELKVGDSIVQKINEGLEKSGFLIIVFSEFSIKSDWVLRELNSTLMRQLTTNDVKILPLLLEVEHKELPPLLSDIYGVKFSRKFINETEYQKLIEPIRKKAKSDELMKYQDVYFDNIVHIDLILDKKQPTRHEVEFILKLIQDANYRNYFLKEVSALHWFNILKEEDYFKPCKETNPIEKEEKGLFSIPQWNVLPYLEEISKQINIPGNEKYINELLSIIKDVSNYKDASGQHIDNFRTWWYFVKILLNIPNDKIPFDIIELIPIWLDSKFDTVLQGSDIATKLLPKFLPANPTKEDIQKAEKIIHYITAFKTFPLSEERAKLLGRKEENKLAIDSHWLKEAFKKHSEIIGEKCSRKIVEDMVDKIKPLLKDEASGTYVSFYNETEYRISEPLAMLTFILKRILLAKAKSDVTATREILKKFLEDKYLYFPKMALYVIGQNMDKYGGLICEVLDTYIGDIITEKTLYLGDELKYSFENLKNLTDEQKQKLNTKIENAAKRQATKEHPEKFIAIHKQEIYDALSHDEYFRNLYDEMKKITNMDVALHPAIGKVETRWRREPSPLTKEEILEMSNNKLADFLATFNTKDSWTGPTVDGLADSLKEVAKEQPEKFISELSPFLNSGYLYIYRIIWGIRDAWNNKKSVEWNSLLDFIKKYINRDEFWHDKFIIADGHWNAGREWVLGMIGELIQDGTKDDNWAFEEHLLPEAQEILLLIIDKLKAEEEREITDTVTHALNSTFGKIITALIYLALRIARLEDKEGKKKEIKWSNELKSKYEKVLVDGVIEAYTLLGRYMPNLFYLDKSWINKKIKDFENIEKEHLWSAFMDGYLSIGNVYDDLYKLMKKHYFKDITYSFKEKHSEESLIQHIAVGYLRGVEDYSANSLFGMVLENWNPSHIKEIIQYFWMQRKSLVETIERDVTIASLGENERFKKRIIEFWKWLYEKYKDKESLNDDDKQILSNVGKLAVFLPKINKENFEWMMLSSPYVHISFCSPFFIKYLDELKNKEDEIESARYVGKIFLKILEVSFPDYDQKHIRSIVEYLYEVKDKETVDAANIICNIYGSRGNEFLRDIYEK